MDAKVTANQTKPTKRYNGNSRADCRGASIRKPDSSAPPQNDTRASGPHDDKRGENCTSKPQSACHAEPFAALEGKLREASHSACHAEQSEASQHACHAEPFAALEGKLREASHSACRAEQSEASQSACHAEPFAALEGKLREASHSACHAEQREASGHRIQVEHRVISLTQGKFAIVDAADYDRLAEHKWYAHTNKARHFYAERKCRGGIIAMHRAILDVPPGLFCDHKNHNTLDNRRCNLRICTPAQNSYNRLPDAGGTSRYKGVHWDKDRRKWQAGIRHKGRLIHLGYYDYEADAAIAYDDRAVELFGEFACLNFNHRPEIKLWIQATYLFEPTKNNLATNLQPEPVLNSQLPVAI